MTAEELAEIIIDDKLEEQIFDAARNGFTPEQLRVGITLLRSAIGIAIERVVKDSEKPE